MTGYRDDPRWQEAQSVYAAEDYETDPDVAYVRRIEAAFEMREITREYANPGVCPRCGAAKTT